MLVLVSRTLPKGFAMTNAAAVQDFIKKWERNTQKESSAAKEHFADLCRILGVPTPNDPGSGPDTYCFEKSLTCCLPIRP